MWMADNSTLLLYLFASGLQCPAPNVRGPTSRGSGANALTAPTDRTSTKFTVGSCPIEGIAWKTACNGDVGSDAGFGDICTGGLYSYDVKNGEWTNFLTNKNITMTEKLEATYPREHYIPASRNDAIQWSPHSEPGVFIFGGVGCPGEPFDGSSKGCEGRALTTLVDLWYFDVKHMWIPLGGFNDQGFIGQAEQNVWPDWLHGRTAWSSSASRSNQMVRHPDLWMFGGLRPVEERPTAELWYYEYRNPHTLGSWTQLSLPSTAPSARYAATSWGTAGTSSAAAYIYGGVGVAIDRGTGAQSKPGSTSSPLHVLLDDLWSFNGDKDRPVFTKFSAPRLSVSYTSWPPPGTGSGWAREQQLWLWTPPQADPAKTGTTSVWQSSNQLWVFSIQLQQWERVGGGRQRQRQQEAEEKQLLHPDHMVSTWPGPRDAAIVADGFIFGGVGHSDCGAASTSLEKMPGVDDWRSGRVPPAQSLVGLWRLPGRK